MRKNAFTLVELLAVIAILGIIATITTPIVLNVLTSAREKAFEDNALSLSKAADNYYAALTLDSETKIPLLITYTNGEESNLYLNNSNNQCETSTDRMLEYSGENPYSGNIYIDKEGNVSMAIYDDQSRKCAIKEPGDKTVTITDKTESECKLDNTPC